jgi:transcriptional regulator with GAF, ATPase, and Fis domain
VPLLVVNCAAIPESLLESELFGHERGAFTGAHARRIGRFEQARGGTVLLDEIGDVSLIVQPKILRLLQQRTFERVGGNETIESDVRVLAATNRNLESALSDGSFREDLYHRLNVVTIQIPPLRERRGDIPKLVNYFADRYAHELQIDRPLISGEALDVLSTRDWPGNVRELEHCIYRALIFTQGYPVQAAHVRPARDETRESASTVDDMMLKVVRGYLDGHCGKGTHERVLEEFERLLIREAMRRTKGNQSHAAQLLGLARPTLHAKIQRLGIQPEDCEPTDV